MPSLKNVSRRSPRSFLLVACAMLGVLAPAVFEAVPVRAAPVPFGTVLVSGQDWAGASSALGDLNVYSNGSGSTDRWGPYGLEYECVELATRWAAIRFGDNPWSWNIWYAYQMWSAGPHLQVPFQQLSNGGSVPPQFGDILVFSNTATNATGHVAVVAGVGPGYVDIVEQNWNNSNPTGRARLPISGTTMPIRYGLPIIGWLRASTAPTGLQGNAGPGGYTLDGYGSVHPFGSAPPAVQGPSWPGWDIARSVARIPGQPSGYVLDGFGGVHPFGAAVSAGVTSYWPNWNIARGIAIRPDGHSGYVVDGWGGIHPFGGAPPVALSAYWPGWDIVRGIVLRPDGVSGYTLDGWGGVHPFGDAPEVDVTGYWSGWDIARSITLRTDGISGWVVDGYNGVHSFGGAPAVASTGYFPGQDVARGVMALDAAGGYTVTAWGNVRAFGDAPPVEVSATFSSAVAHGLS